MVRCLLSVAALVLVLASGAQAAPINLLLTMEIYSPTVGTPEVGVDFRFFESPTNGWPRNALGVPAVLIPVNNLAAGGAVLLPGVTEFNVSLEVSSLDNVYFTSHGDYRSLSGPFQIPVTSIFVGEPPTGAVADDLALAFGPPWIPLANLGAGFSGDFRYITGESRGPMGIGTWALAAVPAPITPVPEPASVLLLGSGLAAVAAKKYRNRKPDAQ